MNVPPPKDKKEIEETRSEPLPTLDNEATTQICSTSLPVLGSERDPSALSRRRKSTGGRHYFKYGEYFFCAPRTLGPNTPAKDIVILPITPEEFAQSPDDKKRTYP